MLDTFLQDLRLGLRKIASAPGFSLAVVGSLALAIGANAVIFSLVYGVLLRSLPYPDPERLLLVSEVDREADGQELPLSVPNLTDYSQQNKVLEGMAGFFAWNAALSGEPHAERIDAAVVSTNMFDVLGVKPVLGRGFLPEESQEGKDGVAVLGHGLWQARFGSDPKILGKTVRLEGLEFTVIGVMQPGFDFPQKSQFWKPFVFPPTPRDFNFIRTVARLKPGVSLESAQAEMDVLAQNLEKEYPDTNQGRGIGLVRLNEQIVGDVRPALLVLQGAVGLVLLIACVNISNLLLFRSTLRQGEIALRTALGAGRKRLVRQLLTEALVLALLGGLAGVLLAYWGLNGLLPLLQGNVPRLDAVRLDRTVLALSAAVSLGTALLFGLIPAVYSSRPDFGHILRTGFRTPRIGAGQRLQQVAVVSQVAIALALVIGAGLLIKSFQRLVSVDPGFQADNVLALPLNLVPETKYADQQSTTAFYTELLDRVRALPGVEVAGATWRLPLAGGSGGVVVEVEGRPDVAKGEEISAHPATPGYFETMGIPLLKGRVFDPRDDADGLPVVIVNEVLAKHLWPGEDAIGKRLTFELNFGPAGQVAKATREVVGVIGNVRETGLDQDTPTQLYFPYYQSAWRWSTLVVRTTQSNPVSLAPAIRRELEKIDPELAPNAPLTVADLVAKSVAQRRLSMVLLSAFAGIALVLAALGIYGVASFAVSQRTRELGIRMALGAQKGTVAWLVLRRALLLGLVGVGVGLLAAFGMTQYLASLLFGVSTLDVATFTLISVVLLLVTLLASYLPARRATRVEPVTAIRYE